MPFLLGPPEVREVDISQEPYARSLMKDVNRDTRVNAGTSDSNVLQVAAIVLGGYLAVIQEWILLALMGLVYLVSREVRKDSRGEVTT